MTMSGVSAILDKASVYAVYDFLFEKEGHDESEAKILTRGKNLRRKKKGFLFVADGNCSACPHLAVQVLLPKEAFLAVREDVSAICEIGRKAISKVVKETSGDEKVFLSDAWYKGYVYHRGELLRAW